MLCLERARALHTPSENTHSIVVYFQIGEKIVAEYWKYSDWVVIFAGSGEFALQDFFVKWIVRAWLGFPKYVYYSAIVRRIKIGFVCRKRNHCKVLFKSRIPLICIC